MPTAQTKSFFRPSMPIVPSPPVSAPNQPRPSTMPPLSDRRALLRLMSLAPLLPLGACGGGGADSGAAAAPTSATTSAPTGDASAQSGASANATSPARTWKMGFGGAPPLPTLDSLLANIAMWRTRADFTVMHDDLPWAELLAGVPAQTLVQRDKKALVNYYRSLGLGIVFMVDANDGLARGQDAAALRALGRSMTELRVQQLYRDYAVAVAQVLQPDSIGLAPESNLVRAMAPAAQSHRRWALLHPIASSHRFIPSLHPIASSRRQRTPSAQPSGDALQRCLRQQLRTAPAPDRPER